MGKFKISYRPKFHMPRSSSVLVITIKLLNTLCSHAWMHVKRTPLEIHFIYFGNREIYWNFNTSCITSAHPPPQNDVNFIIIFLPFQIIFMRTALFSVIRQQVVVNSYQSFGTTYWSIFRGPTGCSLKIEPISCPETSVRDYHYSVCNNPEEDSPHLHRGRSLKSHK